MFFDKLNPVAFFISFFIGLLICYIMEPDQKIVVKFPSPINADKIIYKDIDNSCYKIKASKESCPIDKNLIKEQPLF